MKWLNLGFKIVQIKFKVCRNISSLHPTAKIKEIVWKFFTTFSINFNIHSKKFFLRSHSVLFSSIFYHIFDFIKQEKIKTENFFISIVFADIKKNLDNQTFMNVKSTQVDEIETLKSEENDDHEE